MSCATYMLVRSKAERDGEPRRCCGTCDNFDRHPEHRLGWCEELRCWTDENESDEYEIGDCYRR